MKLLCPFVVLEYRTKEELDDCLEINDRLEDFVGHRFAETVLDTPLENLQIARECDASDNLSHCAVVS
jgi:hypothetical protein